MKTGFLRSRNDEQNPHPRDVAAAGVIDARCEAHDRVRLYFRPKTPTQYHIEGIRRPEDCAYPEAHAPVLIMFMLDAKHILSLPDIMLSNKNMQLGSAETGGDEEFFASIPFQKVYTEGNTGGDRTITDARCAEVLPSSPLALADCVRSICFRSEPERDTVLHMLGEHRNRWSTYFRVSDALKVFEKKFTFVQEIGLTPEGVIFRLNPREDHRPLDVSITAHDSQGARAINFRNSSLSAAPTDGSHRWIYRTPLTDGEYLVEVHLDGHMAYRAVIPLYSVLF